MKKQIELGINSSASAMFAQYFNSCYPSGCSQTQHAEVKQAFYSGIFSFLALTLSDQMPDDEDVVAQKINRIYEECKNVLKATLNTGGFIDV